MVSITWERKFMVQQQPQLLWTHLIILGRKNKHCMDVCKATYAAHIETLKMSKTLRRISLGFRRQQSLLFHILSLLCKYCGNSKILNFNYSWGMFNGVWQKQINTWKGWNTCIHTKPSWKILDLSTLKSTTLPQHRWNGTPESWRSDPPDLLHSWPIHILAKTMAVLTEGP